MGLKQQIYSGKGFGYGTNDPLADFHIQGSSRFYDMGPHGSPAVRVPRAKRSVITNLQSGHGWGKQSAQGTQIPDDTTNFVMGSQSLKLITDGAGSAVFTRKTGLASANLTGRQLSVWVYVSEVAKCTEFWIYATSDASFSSHYVWKLSDDLSQLKDGQWQEVTLSFGAATTVGTPDRSAITALQWRVKDNASAAITCNLGGVQHFAEPAAGVCTIMFDDNHGSVWSLAKPEMDKYGQPGTIAVIPSLVGAPNYMTLAQLQQLQQMQGWDMVSHTYSHTNLTTLSAREIEDDFQRCLAYMSANGFSKGAHHLAYPNGGYDYATVLPLVRKYFRSGRTIANYPETVVPGNPYALRVLLVTNATTTSTIQTAVTRALNNKDWLILVFHQIVSSGAGASTQYLASDFATVVSNINTQGIAVKTLPDVLDFYA